LQHLKRTTVQKETAKGQYQHLVSCNHLFSCTKN